MRKILAAAAAVMLICSMTVTVFAANANNVPDDKNIDVQAVYVSEFDDVDVGTAGSGDPIPLPDGGNIIIDTDNDDDNGLRYVITLITADKAEAYEYVSEAVSEIGKDFYAVHIAFYRGVERVEPSGNVTITMTAPNGYDSAEFIYIASDGQLMEIGRETVNGNIVFNTDKGGYFVLVNAGESSLPDSSSSGSESSSEAENSSSSDSSDGSSSTDTSSDDSSNTGTGSDDSGNTGTGSDDSGNTGIGSDDSGNTGIGSDDSGNTGTGSDGSNDPQTSSYNSDSAGKDSSSSASSNTSGSSDKNTSNPNTGTAVGTGIALIGGLALSFVKGKRDKDE